LRRKATYKWEKRDSLGCNVKLRQKVKKEIMKTSYEPGKNQSPQIKEGRTMNLEGVEEWTVLRKPKGEEKIRVNKGQRGP